VKLRYCTLCTLVYSVKTEDISIMVVLNKQKLVLLVDDSNWLCGVLHEGGLPCRL